MTAETDLLPSSVAAFTEALKGERGPGRHRGMDGDPRLENKA